MSIDGRVVLEHHLVFPSGARTGALPSTDISQVPMEVDGPEMLIDVGSALPAGPIVNSEAGEPMLEAQSSTQDAPPALVSSFLATRRS